MIAWIMTLRVRLGNHRSRSSKCIRSKGADTRFLRDFKFLDLHDNGKVKIDIIVNRLNSEIFGLSVAVSGNRIF